MRSLVWAYRWNQMATGFSFGFLILDPNVFSLIGMVVCSGAAGFLPALIAEVGDRNV